MMKTTFDREIVTYRRKDNQYPAEDIDPKFYSGDLSQVATAKRAWFWQVNINKIILFITSLFLFILAIVFMKNGARGLLPLVTQAFSITNAVDSLGFGWLFAYLVMSGSPVAAAALTFFDAGIIDKLAAFSMIAGSRLGASVIVLMIGFLYLLRGRDRSTSLSTGLLSLIVTITTYLPALFLGAFILRLGVLDYFQLTSTVMLNSAIDWIFNPVVTSISSILPQWAVFLVGLVVIVLSFNLFDRCLPQVTQSQSNFGRMSRLIYQPWMMFMLGAMITMVSMSVSLSLSILVPLSTRGFVRREGIIPYIMGANITTFIDTLLAAVLLNNPPAFTIVFVEMVSITVVSMFILLALYKPYHKSIIHFEKGLLSSNPKLVGFIFLIILIPLVLLINF